MKKILLFVIPAFFSLISSFAQVTTCCPQFILSDDAHIFPCKFDDRCSNPSNGTGNGQPTNAFACKNNVSRYHVFPNLPGFTYIWTVAGGTPSVYTGNPVAVTWGNGSQGQLSVIISNADSSCRDTLSVTYCLLNSPRAVFTYTPNTSICSGTNIQFNDSSSGGNSYYWDFGDGNTSILANPSHQYATPGSYTVTLTVSNVFDGEKCGCSATYTSVITVNPGSSPEIQSGCKKMLCPGDTSSYCVVSTCPPFNWTVNGGTIMGASNQQCITVQWNTPPVNYPTSVTVSTGTCANQCSSTATLNVPVLYNNIPIAGDTVVCQLTTHTYTLPALPGTFYSWSVSGGGQIAGLDSNTVECNVLWTGAAPSTDTVTCNYSNPFTGCSGTSVLIVHINPKFAISGASPVCVGGPGNYFVNNLGNANWTINPATGFTPPGPFNNLSNFSLTWDTARTYVISAVPVIASNYCTASASLNVVVNDTPSLGNIAGQAVVCSGNSYIYSVPSNMNAGQFFWTVSAGDTILSAMGAHKDSIVVQWNGSGPHTLSVYQIVNGCPSQTVSVNISNVLPPVIITGTPNACVDQNFTYSALNNLPVGSYSWSIKPVNAGTIIGGQGTSSILIQWHGSTMTSTTYDTVYVATCGGVDSFFVTVTMPPATSIIPAGYLCSGKTLSSTLSGVSYQWYLNDNPIPSTNLQTIPISQAGNYMVYVYQSPGACPSIGKINILPDKKPYLVLPCGTGIFENLPPDTTSIKYCANSPISSSMNVVTPVGSYTFQWYQNSFGNQVGTNSSGYVATQTGVYWVVVTNNTSLCKDTLGIVKIDTICCDATHTMNFTNNGCDTIHFQASVNPVPTPLFPYSWCFGDGSGATTIPDTVSHKYKNAGQYTVCVYTKVKIGSDTCAVNFCKTIDVPLVAEFDTLVSCGTVALTDLSTSMPAYAGYSIVWNTTGPGVFSPNNTVANPVITYSASGTYLITLTISKNGCTSVISKNVTVFVLNAGINGPSTVCAGTYAPFTASPNNSLFQYAWNFGDNATSFIPNTNHSYPVPPPFTYTIKLVITDTHGCMDSATQLINVIPPPAITISPDTFICPGNSVILSTTPGFQTYQWYLNGNPISGANTNTDTTNVIGEYWVVVTSNNGGCQITSPKTHVFFHGIPIAEIIGSSTACINAPNPANIFLYNSTALPNYSYNWVMEGSNTSLSTNYYLSDLQNTPGTYSYVLTVTDTTGCSVSDTFCVYVSIAPQVVIVPATAGVLCSGHTYSFTANASPANPNYIYQWSNGYVGQTMTTGQPGSYSVNVTNPLSGCTTYAGGISISKSPSTILFPVGCDSLCDTVKIIPPLALNANNNYGIYTIQWFDNGNYGSPIFTGPVFPVGILSVGNHSISIVVTFGTCSDTSNVYNIFVKNCSNSVPVRITYFTAEKLNQHSLLTWKSEINDEVDHYEVFRSLNGISFSQIGVIKNIAGRGVYSFIDSNVNVATYFYKIKVVNKSGEIYYTYIRSVKFSGAENKIQLYPNPVINGRFTISSPDIKNKLINVYNNKGSLMLSIISTGTIDTIDAGKWAKGIYLVKILSNDGGIQTKQMILIR